MESNRHNNAPTSNGKGPLRSRHCYCSMEENKSLWLCVDGHLGLYTRLYMCAWTLEQCFIIQLAWTDKQEDYQLWVLYYECLLWSFIRFQTISGSSLYISSVAHSLTLFQGVFWNRTWTTVKSEGTQHL